MWNKIIYEDFTWLSSVWQWLFLSLVKNVSVFFTDPKSQRVPYPYPRIRNINILSGNTNNMKISLFAPFLRHQKMKSQKQKNMR